MFVGHYGVALAAKPVGKHVPLWVWFIAVQWLDVIWSILVLMGIEKLHIVPGLTEANALDLYYMRDCSYRCPLRWPRSRRGYSSSCQTHHSPPVKLIFSRPTTS